MGPLVRVEGAPVQAVKGCEGGGGTCPGCEPQELQMTQSTRLQSGALPPSCVKCLRAVVFFREDTVFAAPLPWT